MSLTVAIAKYQSCSFDCICQKKNYEAWSKFVSAAVEWGMGTLRSPRWNRGESAPVNDGISSFSQQETENIIGGRRSFF